LNEYLFQIHESKETISELEKEVKETENTFEALKKNLKVRELTSIIS
jgi:hypothetical protein